MKPIVLSLLLFALVSCQLELSHEKHRRRRSELNEKVRACILNSTASETLKNAYKENTTSRVVYSSIKDKIDETDKTILKSCRREAFKALRHERLSDSDNHFPSPFHTHNYLEKLEEVKSEFFSCIEQTTDITDNLKKFLNEHKKDDLKDFFKEMKEELNYDEKRIVRKCRRKALKGESGSEPRSESKNEPRTESKNETRTESKNETKATTQ